MTLPQNNSTPYVYNCILDALQIAIPGIEGRKQFYSHEYSHNRSRKISSFSESESEVRNDKLVTYSFYIIWDILPEKRMKFPQNY